MINMVEKKMEALIKDDPHYHDDYANLVFLKGVLLNTLGEEDDAMELFNVVIEM